MEKKKKKRKSTAHRHTHPKNREPMPKKGSCLFALLEDLFIYDGMLKIMSP